LTLKGIQPRYASLVGMAVILKAYKVENVDHVVYDFGQPGQTPLTSVPYIMFASVSEQRGSRTALMLQQHLMNLLGLLVRWFRKLIRKPRSRS
jgi:hypothetical protein